MATELKEKGYKQIHRNYLPTYVYAKRNKFKYFANVVISPKIDKGSIKEIEDLRKDLLLDPGTILKISLKYIIERGMEFDELDFDKLMRKFKRMYLEFS